MDANSKQENHIAQFSTSMPFDQEKHGNTLKANSHMIGGNHYRKVEGEQLWDRLVRLNGLANARVFFTGNIIAYVERYLDKDYIKDLKKARHYLDKLIELETIEANGGLFSKKSDTKSFDNCQPNSDFLGED